MSLLTFRKTQPSAGLAGLDSSLWCMYNFIREYCSTLCVEYVGIRCPTHSRTLLLAGDAVYSAPSRGSVGMPPRKFIFWPSEMDSKAL